METRSSETLSHPVRAATADLKLKASTINAGGYSPDFFTLTDFYLRHHGNSCQNGHEIGAVVINVLVCAHANNGPRSLSRAASYRMYCRGSSLPIEHDAILILQRTSNAEIEVCFASEIRP